MKTLRLICLTMALSLPAFAEEQLRRIDFTVDEVLPAGQVLDDGTLRVAAETGAPFRLLFELENPGITSPVYALKGTIRYEGIEGDAYLQMDNDFGDNGSYFTKTLASTGPLRKLSGNSDWRPFVLPFYANTGDQVGESVLTPGKLSVSLYLPGAGTVFIRDVRLYEYANGEDPLRTSGQWLGHQTMALTGAIGGSLIGLWSALIGFLASRGKARGFVLGSVTVLIVLGVVAVAAGALAVLTSQPYAVYYPLLLVGIILVVVYGSVRRGLPRRYEAIELKKMQAMDA